MRMRKRCDVMKRRRVGGGVIGTHVVLTVQGVHKWVVGDKDFLGNK